MTLIARAWFVRPRDGGAVRTRAVASIVTISHVSRVLAAHHIDRRAPDSTPRARERRTTRTCASPRGVSRMYGFTHGSLSHTRAPWPTEQTRKPRKSSYYRIHETKSSINQPTHDPCRPIARRPTGDGPRRFRWFRPRVDWCARVDRTRGRVRGEAVRLREIDRDDDDQNYGTTSIARVENRTDADEKYRETRRHRSNSCARRDGTRRIESGGDRRDGLRVVRNNT